MYRWLNNWLKAFFTLSKSEQRGVIFLVALIIIILIINLSLPLIVSNISNSDNEINNPAITAFIKEQKLIRDSVEITALQNSGNMDYKIAKSRLSPVIFNPNKYPVESWLKMGFTEKQIKTIKNYEAKGGKFRKKEDLKKIYSISEIEYNIIAPFILIPSPYKTKTGKQISKKLVTTKTDFKQVNINSADSVQLLSSLGLSPWLVKRTLAYRRLLGGYNNVNQLKEVYGLSNNLFQSIKSYVNIDTSRIVKININEVTFKDLLRHPYFDYNTTKSLINTRTKIGSFSSVDQLIMVEGINDSLLIKVSDYLYIRPN